jgi:hypothetical protein
VNKFLIVLSALATAYLPSVLLGQDTLKNVPSGSQEVTELLWYSHHLAPGPGQTQIEWIGTHQGKQGVFVVIGSPEGVKFACFNTCDCSCLLKASHTTDDEKKFFASDIPMNMGVAGLPFEKAVYLVQAAKNSHLAVGAADSITATYSKDGAPEVIKTILEKYSEK